MDIDNIISHHDLQDIAAKILSFSQQRARAICILSANGVVSAVTLRQPAVTYEVENLKSFLFFFFVKLLYVTPLPCHLFLFMFSWPEQFKVRKNPI